MELEEIPAEFRRKLDQFSLYCGMTSLRFISFYNTKFWIFFWNKKNVFVYVHDCLLRIVIAKDKKFVNHQKCQLGVKICQVHSNAFPTCKIMNQYTKDEFCRRSVRVYRSPTLHGKNAY
jgi:hypothetical protein